MAAVIYKIVSTVAEKYHGVKVIKNVIHVLFYLYIQQTNWNCSVRMGYNNNNNNTYVFI